MSQKRENKLDQEPEADEEEVQDSTLEADGSEEVLEGEISEAQPEVSGEEAELAPEELLQAALAKAESNRNDYLRCVADTQNLRKRTARDIKKARSFAIEGFARDLLPVADNMMRALAALSDNDEPSVQSLREGVEMVQKELDRAFEKHGLIKISALNATFDPNLHQAVVQIDAPDAEPGQVVQEMQIGYTLNDRLLRPAMVGVAKS